MNNALLHGKSDDLLENNRASYQDEFGFDAPNQHQGGVGDSSTGAGDPFGFGSLTEKKFLSGGGAVAAGMGTGMVAKGGVIDPFAAAPK